MKTLIRGDRSRWLAMIAVAAVAIGAYAISPAIGGGTFTAKRAKKLFYTKTQANGRFAAAGCCAADTGTIRVSQHAGYWKLISQGTGTSTLGGNAAEAIISSAAGSTNIAAEMPLTAPQTLLGIPLRLTGMEVCYDTENNSTMTELGLYRQRDTAGDPAAPSVILLDDLVPHTDSTCRTYTTAPLAVDPSDQLVVFAQMDIGGGGGNVNLTRATLTLQP